ncbi:hypothetical protein [Streptomyces sp. NPDC001315]|uniref:hypothetical protein n=1 Tax=Streptomyces sp. NPDC001315 TaxID=3364562 RepID=UPI0036B17847
MSTGVMIALIVIVVAVVAVAAALTLRARGSRSGGGLKRRFGPEYDRAVAGHDGDVQAAERELSERVERHGGLRERPLEPAEREQYEARWTAVQERFVDSPAEAVTEADRLLAEVAGARGFPDSAQYEEQLAALSVHHADHVQGYRRVHRAVAVRTNAGDGGTGTEEMREALVEARGLFEDLMAPARQDTGRHRAGHDSGRTPDDRRPPARSNGHGAPWAFTRRHAKGS